MKANWNRREMMLTAAGGTWLRRFEPDQETAVAKPEKGAEPAAGVLKIALVGAAHIHTPAFLKLIAARTDMAVTHVWDFDRGRAEAAAAQAGSARICADRREIWSDPAIAAAVLLSETVRHRELVLEAAAAGKPVFVEKPLGTGREDAAAMAAAVARSGVLFQTGYFMRGEPVSLFLREQLKKGVFGKITRVRICVSNAGSLEGMFAREYGWMTDRKQAGFGGFGDIGMHGLDLLLWWFGKPARVTGRFQTLSGSPEDGNQNGEAILEFKNGLLAVLAAGWLDRDNPMPIYIGGTTGCAYKQKDRFYFQSDAVEGADGRRAWNKFPAAWSHPLDLFLDAVAGRKEVPLVSAGEAAEGCAVMEAIGRAAEEHCWVDI